MAINNIRKGAIIIAGSGMCTGGRIRHHLKYNISRKKCHVVITGFQVRGTTGRALVDGARSIRLEGTDVPVKAKIHTLGALSAHADQKGLMKWYANFKKRPSLVLVHGEKQAAAGLSEYLQKNLSVKAQIATSGSILDLTKPDGKIVRS